MLYTVCDRWWVEALRHALKQLPKPQDQHCSLVWLTPVCTGPADCTVSPLEDAFSAFVLL
jgi:hypothetical protein